MKVKISSNVEFFKHYPKGREAEIWDNKDNKETFGSLISQWTAEIFLTRNLKGGIHKGGVRNLQL